MVLVNDPSLRIGGFWKSDCLPQKVLFLFQHIQSLWEDRSNGAPSHLDLQVLAIRLVTRPWDLVSYLAL
jgi:hypothetical protein